MITAPELEIAVLVLGMVILMVEAFATQNRQTNSSLHCNCRSGDSFSGELLRGSIFLAQSSDRFLEFLHCRPAIDLLQAVRAADDDPRAHHDDRLRPGGAQFLSRYARRMWANFLQSQSSPAPD